MTSCFENWLGKNFLEVYLIINLYVVQIKLFIRLLRTPSQNGNEYVLSMGRRYFGALSPLRCIAGHGFLREK